MEISTSPSYVVKIFVYNFNLEFCNYSTNVLFYCSSNDLLNESIDYIY